nr:hypothetical protein [Streptomyces sp. NBC_01717]
MVAPTHGPVADHGRRYAERLRAAGTTPARAAILEFLEEPLTA